MPSEHVHSTWRTYRRRASIILKYCTACEKHLDGSYTAYEVPNVFDILPYVQPHGSTNAVSQEQRAANVADASCTFAAQYLIGTAVASD